MVLITFLAPQNLMSRETPPKPSRRSNIRRNEKLAASKKAEAERERQQIKKNEFHLNKQKRLAMSTPAKVPSNAVAQLGSPRPNLTLAGLLQSPQIQNDTRVQLILAGALEGVTRGAEIILQTHESTLRSTDTMMDRYVSQIREAAHLLPPPAMAQPLLTAAPAENIDGYLLESSSPCAPTAGPTSHVIGTNVADQPNGVGGGATTQGVLFSSAGTSTTVPANNSNIFVFGATDHFGATSSQGGLFSSGAPSLYGTQSTTPGNGTASPFAPNRHFGNALVINQASVGGGFSFSSPSRGNHGGLPVAGPPSVGSAGFGMGATASIFGSSTPNGAAAFGSPAASSRAVGIAFGGNNTGFSFGGANAAPSVDENSGPGCPSGARKRGQSDDEVMVDVDGEDKENSQPAFVQSKRACHCKSCSVCLILTGRSSHHTLLLLDLMSREADHQSNKMTQWTRKQPTAALEWEQSMKTE